MEAQGPPSSELEAELQVVRQRVVALERQLGAEKFKSAELAGRVAQRDAQIKVLRTQVDRLIGEGDS